MLFRSELETCKKSKSEIQYLKEYRLFPPLQSIPFDVRKSSIAIFMAEVLYKVIREEEQNKPLFDFLYNSILILESTLLDVENFHLHFLANLSRFLGFYPNSSTIMESSSFLFNIKDGRFTSVMPDNRFLCFNAEKSMLLMKMLETSFGRTSSIGLNRNQRNSFLEAMLGFFTYHFNSLCPIKSLDVFKEIFNN